MDNVGSGELEIYLRSYWDYYLALEGRLLQTERFCAFSERNAGAYSVEYLTLFLAACGEIDALGKEVARRFYPNVDLGQCSINKWGYYLCEAFPELGDKSVELAGQTFRRSPSCFDAASLPLAGVYGESPRWFPCSFLRTGSRSRPFPAALPGSQGRFQAVPLLG